MRSRVLIAFLLAFALAPLAGCPALQTPGPVTPGETAVSGDNALLLRRFDKARTTHTDLIAKLATLRQQGQIRPNRGAVIQRAIEAGSVALAAMERAAFENDADAYSRADVDLSRQNAVLRTQIRELTTPTAPTTGGP